jgi:hypothetical protein
MSSTFETFTISEWSNWLHSAIYRLPVDPPIPFSDPETHIALRDLYLTLPLVARHAFADAVVRLFEVTQPETENLEGLFVLIQLLSVVGSPKSRELIRQRIATRSLEGFEYSGYDLVDLLIQAASEQTVDEDLVELCERVALGSPSRRRALTCLRVASKRGDGAYTRFLGRVLMSLRTEADIRAACDQLALCLKRTGHRHFFQWLNNEYPQTEIDPTIAIWFEAGLASTTLAWNPARSDDSYFVLASAWANAGKREFTPSDLFRVASQARRVPREAVANVLIRIRNNWIQSSKFTLSLTSPWRIFYPADYAHMQASLHQMFELQTDAETVERFPSSLSRTEEELLSEVSKDFLPNGLVM